MEIPMLLFKILKTEFYDLDNPSEINTSIKKLLFTVSGTYGSLS